MEVINSASHPQAAMSPSGAVGHVRPLNAAGNNILDMPTKKTTNVKQSNFNEVIPHLTFTGRYVNLCFDIGGVLLKPNLDVSHGTALHPALFKRMMRSHAWHQYQEGKLSWTQTLQQLSLGFDVNEDDIQTFVDRARASLSPVPEIVDMIQVLSATQKLKLYCMTNAAKEDCDYMLAAFPDLFHKFEKVFYSGAVGSRKPNFGYFHHFLHETGCKPSETIFIDDMVQNVVAAEVVGLTTILVKESATEVVNFMVYHLRTEEERLAAAFEYLRGKRGVEKGTSLTSDGYRIQVLYDHFIIAELLNDPSFLPVHEIPESGTFNFLPQKELQGNGASNTSNAYTHKNLPDDLDATAMALSALHKFSKVDMTVINAVVSKMLECVTEDGVFLVYFDPLRERTDHVVQTVTCNLFHIAGRPGPVRKMEGILYQLLKSGAFLLGSLYYPLPEVFLWHLARLVDGFKEHDAHEVEFADMVAKRVGERVGMPGTALALAMRVIACGYFGISCEADRKELARMQKVDGSWDLCPFYSYSDPKSWIGNEVTTTAFAVAALQTRNE